MVFNKAVDTETMMSTISSIFGSNTLYYHSTSLAGSVLILKNGMDIQECSPFSDFGQGFYLNGKLEGESGAIQWAKQKSSFTVKGKGTFACGAILLYTVDFGEFSMKALASETADEEWKSTIKDHRKPSKESKSIVTANRRFDCISGLMCSNGVAVSSGKNPTHYENSLQYVVRDGIIEADDAMQLLGIILIVC